MTLLHNANSAEMCMPYFEK